MGLRGTQIVVETSAAENVEDVENRRVVTEAQGPFQDAAASVPQQPPHPAPYLTDTEFIKQRPCLQGSITD